MRNEGIGAVTAALGLALAPAAMAAIDLQVTEAFTGLTGEDGTVDWIEVTNFGDTIADTGNYWYDDSSQTIADGGNLDSFLLGQGESAVFLLDTSPNDEDAYTTAVEEFVAIWGSGITVGQTNGGGNLGQGGDIATLLDGTDAITDALSYPSEFSGVVVQTIENLSDTTQLSINGQNGAYESAAFFNDDIGTGPEFSVTLIGSPGVVPEPASVCMLLGGAICLASRRRL